MNVFAITSFLCAIFCFLLFVFSLISGRTKIYKLLAVFNLAVALWGSGLLIVALSKDTAMAFQGWKLAFGGGFFIAVIFYHLVTALFNVESGWVLKIGYSQAIAFNLINIFTDVITRNTRKVFDFYYFDLTPVFTVAFLFYSILVVLSYIELVKCLKTYKGYKKEQAKKVFWGFLIGFLGGTSILLPTFHFDGIYPIGNFGIFLYATIVTYATLRLKVFDIDELAEIAHRGKLAAIGTIAASINHEIKNPLYVIQNLADVHLNNFKEGVYSTKDEATEKANQALQKIVAQSMRAIEIMKRFAIFTKQKISYEAHPENLKLQTIVEEVLPLINHELEFEKIQLRQNIPADLPSLRVDKRHLEEILFNLIVNACHALRGEATTNESKSISIAAIHLNDQVSLSVQDNGLGISEKNLKRIFEPFYSTKSDGTGLGLYIVRQLVERNKGIIAVESKVGKGTEFKMIFPKGN